MMTSLGHEDVILRSEAHFFLNPWDFSIRNIWMLIVNSKMSPLLHKKLDYSQMFFKIGVLKNFANFTVKHLCWSLFLIKLQAKKRLQHRCCPVVFAKFLRTSLFK